MNQHAKAAVEAEERRHTEAIVALVKRFPEYRAHLAYVLLGGAIAVCDSYGIDVEGFISELRRVEAKPNVIVPPNARRS